jgi:uridine kinase
MQSRDTVLNQLADVLAGITCPHPLRVAIDGVDAAGKTTLADELAPLLPARRRPVIRASVDYFHNPRAIRYRRGSDSPEGYFHDSFNYTAVKTLLLEPLGPNGNRQYRRGCFDHERDRAVEYPLEHAPDDAILLFDGIFILRPELHAYWDFKIFVDVDFDTMVARAVQRHETQHGPDPEVRARNRNRYVPGQRLYLESCRPKAHADLIFDNRDLSAPSIQYPT